MRTKKDLEEMYESALLTAYNLFVEFYQKDARFTDFECWLLNTKGCPKELKKLIDNKKQIGLYGNIK